MLSEKELNRIANRIISSIGGYTEFQLDINEIKKELEKFVEYGVSLDWAEKSLIKKYKLNSRKKAEEILSRIGKDKNVSIEKIESLLKKYLDVGVPINHAEQTILKYFETTKKLSDETPKAKMPKCNSRIKKINIRFYIYFTLVYTLLFIFSFYMLNITKSNTTTTWFLVALPIISGFLFIFITYCYHVANRLIFLILLVIIITFLFQVSYFQTNTSPESLVSFFFIFLILFLPGAIFAFPLSLLFSVITPLNSQEIKENILIFQLNENDEVKNRILFRIIRTHLAEELGFNLNKVIDKDNYIYSSKNPFSIEYFFFCFYENMLIIFQFRKDGNGYYIKAKPYDSFIEVYLKNLFQVERIDNEKNLEVVNNFINVFDNFSKPNKIVAFIKSLRHLPKKLTRNDYRILALISVFFLSLFLIIILPDITKNLNINLTNIVMNTLTVFGAIGGFIALLTVIVQTFKFLKKRKGKKIRI